MTRDKVLTHRAIEAVRALHDAGHVIPRPVVAPAIAGRRDALIARALALP